MIVEAIIQAIKEQHITKKECAERAGINYPQFTAALKGKQGMNLKTIERVLNVLNLAVVSDSDVLLLEEDNNVK